MQNDEHSLLSTRFQSLCFSNESKLKVQLNPDAVEVTRLADFAVVKPSCTINLDYSINILWHRTSSTRITLEKLEQLAEIEKNSSHVLDMMFSLVSR